MKTKNENRIPLEETSILKITGGSPDPAGDLMYDLSYLLGYGFAWISKYIGNHVADYGIAFK
jgi:hypothetical protein